MVGTGRFELPTPRTPSECSTRLSHVPTTKEPPLVPGRWGLHVKSYTTCRDCARGEITGKSGTAPSRKRFPSLVGRAIRCRRFAALHGICGFRCGAASSSLGSDPSAYVLRQPIRVFRAPGAGLVLMQGRAIAENGVDDRPLCLDCILAYKQHRVAVHGVAQQSFIRIYFVRITL